MQPFGNTVDVTTLTGADIRAVLEQQFQSDQPRGTDLRLGTSEGFAYSYDPAQPYGQRVDPGSITLDGVLVDAGAAYRVVANSFLVGGGDSFTAFTNGTDGVTGPVDVDTSVAYFAANPRWTRRPRTTRRPSPSPRPRLRRPVWAGRPCSPRPRHHRGDQRGTGGHRRRVHLPSAAPVNPPDDSRHPAGRRPRQRDRGGPPGRTPAR